jgi:hypothetical protein
LSLSSFVALIFRYPNELAWEVKASGRQLKAAPGVDEFRQFLINENFQGNINRQEAVSMIPPLLLDVQPHHVVRMLRFCRDISVNRGYDLPGIGYVRRSRFQDCSAH